MALTQEQAKKKQLVNTAVISLRAEESLDRRTILSQGEFSTGQYANSGGVNNVSPVFDWTTEDIWRVFSFTDWDVNGIYERLYEAGVGISDQRVGSLLNYAATRNIGTVKALEPELFGRINARFHNVEFVANFSRNGFYKISKPRDTDWSGKNHIKAGMSQEEITKVSDEYEELLQMLAIPYERVGNEFKTTDPKYIGKPWHPLTTFMKENELL